MKRRANLRCPTCGKVLLVWRDDEQRVLRTRILIFDNGTCLAKCPFCKSEVAVPIKLMDGLVETAEKEDPQRQQPQALLAPVNRGRATSLGRLVRDLEKPVTPLLAYVQTRLNNGGKKASVPESEKLNECMAQVRELGDLIERYLNGSKSSAAGGDGSRKSRRPAGRKDDKTANLSGKSVLVIDKDERVRQFFQLSLGLAGADVTCAGSDDIGIDLVRTHRFDAVFVEIALPRMTGLVRLLEEIGKGGTGGCTAVVYAMTKEAVSRHIDMCRRLGASGVIDKSRSLEDVAVQLQKALQRGRQNGALLEACQTVDERRGRDL